MYISNATFYDGLNYEDFTNYTEHWFSILNYSNFEMNQFVNKNITIYFHSNYFDDWHYDFVWTTEIDKIIVEEGQ